MKKTTKIYPGDIVVPESKYSSLWIKKDFQDWQQMQYVRDLVADEIMLVIGTETIYYHVLSSLDGKCGIVVDVIKRF